MTPQGQVSLLPCSMCSSLGGVKCVSLSCHSRHCCHLLSYLLTEQTDERDIEGESHTHTTKHTSHLKVDCPQGVVMGFPGGQANALQRIHVCVHVCERTKEGVDEQL